MITNNTEYDEIWRELELLSKNKEKNKEAIKKLQKEISEYVTKMNRLSREKYQGR